MSVCHRGSKSSMLTIIEILESSSWVLGKVAGDLGPRINLQGCIVGDGTKLSTIPIGSTRVKFSKVHQMAYRHLGKLIWVQKFFSNYCRLTTLVSCTIIKIVDFATIVAQCTILLNFCQKLFFWKDCPFFNICY